MAYEYEDEIKEYLRYATRPDTEKYLEMHLELTKVYKKAYLLREMTKTMLIPIEEIYAKAKAFDEISQVFKKVTIYNTATALEVKEIIDELEDK